MLWLPVTLLTALSSATGDAILKARFSHLTPARMAIVRTLAPVPFLLPALLSIKWPRLGPDFWQTLAYLVPLEVLALILYMKALKVSPLSLTIPFLAFTPVFIVLTGWLVLGERVSAFGLLGIILTVCGSYVLNIGAFRHGVFAPFKAILKEKGSFLMLGVAIIYSLTSVLGKRAIQFSNPMFFACFYFVLLGFIVPPIMVFLDKRPGSKEKGHSNGLKNYIECIRPSGAWLGVGLSQAVMVLTHMWAIYLVKAAYMIAVKRTSLIFSVLYGKIVFKEEEITQRLAGSALMVLGVALIALSG